MQCSVVGFEPVSPSTVPRVSVPHLVGLGCKSRVGVSDDLDKNDDLMMP